MQQLLPRKEPDSSWFRLHYETSMKSSKSGNSINQSSVDSNKTLALLLQKYVYGCALIHITMSSIEGENIL
jgi:hypothetical protein